MRPTGEGLSTTSAYARQMGSGSKTKNPNRPARVTLRAAQSPAATRSCYMQFAIIEVTNRRTAGSRRNCCSIWPEQSASVHRLRSAKTPSRNTATRFRGGRNRGQREPQTVIIQSNRRLVQKRDLASHAQALLRIGDHSGANPTRRGVTGTPALWRRAIERRERPPRAVGIEAKSRAEFRTEAVPLSS